MQPEQQRGGPVVARVVGGLALLAAALVVVRPFLRALLWAAILAYVTWPLFRRFRDLSARPRLAAALFTLGVFLAVGLPVAWFLVNLAEQASHLVSVVGSWLGAGAPLPAWLTGIPWIGPRLEDLRASVPGAEEIPGHLARIGRVLSEQLVAVAGSVARNVFSFAVALLALYAFYVEGERLVGHARRLASAVFPRTPPEFLENVGAVVRAVVFGLIGTAIVQGVLAGVGFALFGVPSPVALGALTAVLSFVPVGPALVWSGASVYLYLGGRTAAAIGMALWGVLLVSSVDNVLRPLLISRSGAMRIPFLLVFFGVLGGLAAFGMLGLFVGPVVLSVTFALVAEWPHKPPASAGAEASPVGSGAARSGTAKP
jgi:predicted PurR-regulated permease PerM